MNKKIIKEKITLTCKKLKAKGLLPGTSGNISIREKNLVFITPSQIDKEDLKISDISEIDIQGRLLNSVKPSSEYLLHIEIYKKRKDVNAIIHTHPPYVIAYSITKSKINYNLTIEFPLIIKKIAFCPFKKPGTTELAKLAASNIKNSNALILENHGLVCVASNIEKAKIITEEVENFFRINFLVSVLKKFKQ